MTPTLDLRRKSCFAVVALATTLGGCASNPFLDNYVGTRQESTATPERLLTEQELPRLGTSRFDVDMVAGKVPGDEQALAAAKEVGAASYWWSSRPQYNAGNTVARQQQSRGRVGGTAAYGTGFDEKALKWYRYEAIFYASPSKKK